MKKSLRVLGIDPGFARTGYGVIDDDGRKISSVGYGVIETHVGEDFSCRLKFLAQELSKILNKYKPDLVAVEELFFCKNVKTALLVGQARGVILLSIIQKNLPLLEFTPLQIKQAISSYGRADKRQVQQMVKLLLNLKEIPQPDDAADALAIAVCGANSKNALKLFK
jgi:crossover junction endodeoxyribonuclease RuvC